MWFMKSMKYLREMLLPKIKFRGMFGQGLLVGKGCVASFCVLCIALFGSDPGSNTF